MTSKQNQKQLEEIQKLLTPELISELSRITLPKVTLRLASREYLETITATLSQKYAESHKSSQKYLFEYFNEEQQLSEITNEVVQHFITQLIRKVPKGWIVYYRNFRAFFNYLVDREYLSINPFENVVLPRRQKALPEYLNVEDHQSLIDIVENPVIADIITTAFYTGLRRSEIVNLRSKNIDFRNDVIEVGDEFFTTKTKRPRMVPMIKVVKDLMKNNLDGITDPSAFVFRKPSGYKFNADYITHAFKKAAIKAGLQPRTHFHTLRHSTASNLVQRGVPLYDVKEILGHSSISTTEIYAHLNIDSLKISMQKLNTQNSSMGVQ